MPYSIPGITAARGATADESKNRGTLSASKNAGQLLYSQNSGSVSKGVVILPSGSTYVVSGYVADGYVE